MGKHKKFLKSEKAKVKLKGAKLKEAQNVTKTDFKVRKIIITEQLKNVQENGISTRKKHSVNDCITRLKNSSSAEAICNLKDIILYQHDDFQRNIERIIKTAANLSLSIERNDRKESFKILDIICTNSNENVLKPFLPILVIFLNSAMTHIKPAIQEDSLLMLDILLKHAPQLVASQKETILTPYLDMVSKKRNENNLSERSLSLQMGNKITSTKWRTSVLQRLIQFLNCVNNQNKIVCTTNERGIQMDINEKDQSTCNPYRNYELTSHTSSTELEDSNTTGYNESDTKASALQHANMIMPLMFETWIELKDLSSAETNSITHENSIVLKLIMDIFLELYAMIENSEIAKQQFLKKYQERFEKQILCRFPYTQNDGTHKKAQELSGGEKCVYQNLSISILFLAFALKNPQRFRIYRERIFNFIEDCIINWRSKDQEFIERVKKFMRMLFHQKALRNNFGTESKKLFNELLKKCNIDQSSYDPKLALVCEIIEQGYDFSCDSLIDQMVNVLAHKDIVPVHIIKTITSIAKRGDITLFQSLNKHALDILKNLSTLRVSGKAELENADGYKLFITNLFYWINNKNLLNSEFLMSKNDVISKRIKEIILAKN